MTHQEYIKLCIQYAKKGESWTYPNPMVGAIIVKDGKIISTGYHHNVGAPHAEVEAIMHAKKPVSGATLYINLEPCAHTGRTPPCVEMIIRSGIHHVVCSCIDPNPLVSGKGIQALRHAGIEVTVGIGENEAKELNRAFFTFHTEKKPWISLKFASSLDGVIATKTGDAKWISSKKAREYGHSLRVNHQAILVGANTIITDNPNLGTHIPKKRDPLRIILDSKLRVPLNSHAFRDENVLIITTKRAPEKRRNEFEKKGISLHVLPRDTIQVSDIIDISVERKIISILVEGGSKVLGSFIDSHLFDVIFAFHAPIVVGGLSAIHAVAGKGARDIDSAIRLDRIQRKTLDDTLLTIGYKI